MNSLEKNKLQDIAEKSLYSSGVMQTAIDYCFTILKRYLQGASVLEMGPAEGVMTELLNHTGMPLTLVEGSSLFCKNLRLRFPNAIVEQALFEEFEPNEKYDNIVMGHVLEHVYDPVDVITRAKQWLNPGGRIFAAVPNARSLHRQAAAIMGLLAYEGDLNEMDHHHGHRRIYNPETLRSDFIKAGLKINIFGGYWLKPISNQQLEDDWTPEMINAFMQLGERYPDIAAEIYVVASLPSNNINANPT